MCTYGRGPGHVVSPAWAKTVRGWTGQGLRAASKGGRPALGVIGEPAAACRQKYIDYCHAAMRAMRNGPSRTAEQRRSRAERPLSTSRPPPRCASAEKGRPEKVLLRAMTAFVVHPAVSKELSPACEDECCSPRSRHKPATPPAPRAASYRHREPRTAGIARRKRRISTPIVIGSSRQVRFVSSGEMSLPCRFRKPTAARRCVTMNSV